MTSPSDDDDMSSASHKPQCRLATTVLPLCPPQPQHHLATPSDDVPLSLQPQRRLAATMMRPPCPSAPVTSPVNVPCVQQAPATMSPTSIAGDSNFI
ncbi:hypothetical protein SCLCIDRAFT_29756 [Scleroderma citrinum Foug A]|uniref:Uncharacterized protein n=1 Tax=Scleroderma citrinum Foug A TaxID=1036808 RepID=A0A0C3DIR3_9AGAM|nr:hypothetical protein SCLCIDRAFT_29756 [Scleroderma citrinum Foug A]